MLQLQQEHGEILDFLKKKEMHMENKYVDVGIAEQTAVAMASGYGHLRELNQYSLW